MKNCLLSPHLKHLKWKCHKALKSTQNGESSANPTKIQNSNLAHPTQLTIVSSNQGISSVSQEKENQKNFGLRMELILKQHQIFHQYAQRLHTLDTTIGLLKNSYPRTKRTL